MHFRLRIELGEHFSGKDSYLNLGELGCTTIPLSNVHHSLTLRIALLHSV
jgi:hypothetical protein